VLHTTPTDAGAAIAPMLIGWPIASALGGRLLPRLGYRLLVRSGLSVVFVATLVVYVVLKQSLGLTALRLAMFLFGTGMGFANTALIIAVQESVDFRQRGVATASSMFFRTIGGTLAVGALGVLVAHAVSDDVSPRVLTELLGPTHGATLEPALFAQASAAMARGMLPVFLALCVVGALVALTGFAFPKIQARRQKPAAAPASD
jgi:MFS family permease